jgi:hypothetical protein
MARARNIKPSFFTNHKLALCEPLARILFAGLWTIADREGRLEDIPIKIKALVLPYDNCDCDKLLNQLFEQGFIMRYAAGKDKYIQIDNFRKHQNPHVKEGVSTIPAPDKHYTSPVQNVPYPLSPIPLTESLLLNPLSPIPQSVPKRGTAYSEEFELFWKTYPPNGASKMKTNESWSKAINGTEPRIIINAAREYRGYIERTGADFSKTAHATTWLNQQRWTVEYAKSGGYPATHAGSSQAQMGAGQNQGSRTKTEQLDDITAKVLAKYGVEAETSDTIGVQARPGAIQPPAKTMLLDDGVIRQGN